jgi:tellurium resistance protein TerD
LINFDKIPADVAKLAVVVSIYGAGVVFGQVANAYVRVCKCTDENLWLKGEGGSGELRYDLTEEASTSNAMLFCEIVRDGTDWTFKALGESIGDGSGDNGLVPIAQKYNLG